MPSQKILEQKASAVEALSEKIGRAAAGVLVKYQGITVEDDTKLRAALRGAGVEYSVIKNTMIGRACEKAGLTGMESFLDGMNALAISYDDPVAPAKILKEYAEKVETFEIRAGFLDGAVVDVATINELADIPRRKFFLQDFSDPSPVPSPDSQLPFRQLSTRTARLHPQTLLKQLPLRKHPLPSNRQIEPHGSSRRRASGH